MKVVFGGTLSFLSPVFTLLHVQKYGNASAWTSMDLQKREKGQ